MKCNTIAKVMRQGRGYKERAAADDIETNN
jgi:hypothetical protein